MKAWVYKSTGSWYILKNEQGKLFNARIKGVLKLDDITSTNPIAVGDIVEVEMENELENTVTITQIFERKNYVARQSPHNKWQHHIIAANVDQSVLFATLKNPKTSTGFIDRFLVACEMYHLPAIIVFNKIDTYKEKELEQLEFIKEVYSKIGYKVLQTSMKENRGMNELKETLYTKTSLLSGHSGVGKSTFINQLFPELNLKTQEVSNWSGKGLHTTTFAEMFDLPFEGKIIDTPGIRELGLIDVSKQELSGYFPEMRTLLTFCKFNNCLHFNEKDCAIKKAINDGSISEERYLSYLNILDSISDKNY